MSMTEQQRKYLDLLIDEPVEVGKRLGFTDLTELHNEWLKMMIYGKQDMTLLAHRGSYKTTCLSIAIAIMIVLFPNTPIIFLRKTDTDVKEVVTQVAKILSSTLMKHIVNVLYGVDIAFTECNTQAITTNLKTSAKGSSQLLGLGIGTSLTGKHADLVITDDIVNVKDRVSKAERDKTIMSYMELQNIKNRTGRILNTGTPWHKEDCIERYMPNKIVYDCYHTGLIDRETLEKIRQSMTPSLFSANYELKHIADEDALFTNPTFFNDSSLLFDGIAHIDASYGGGDGTAYTICRQRGDKFYMFGKRWNKHVDDCIPEILQYQKMYRAGTISCERNADKGYLEKELRKLDCVVDGYSETTNKFIKISTYLRKHWNEIVWLEDTDPEYMSEILDYTENAVHDDAPDSASCLIRKLTGKAKWLY